MHTGLAASTWRWMLGASNSWSADPDEGGDSTARVLGGQHDD
jgi:hypothetical protein